MKRRPPSRMMRRYLELADKLDAMREEDLNATLTNVEWSELQNIEKLLGDRARATFGSQRAKQMGWQSGPGTATTFVAMRPSGARRI